LSLKKYKLEIELVPSTVWFSSVYQIFKRDSKMNEWQKIKRDLFESEGRRCWICGRENARLEAHEFWEYDDVNHVQKLTAIHHLCGMCHKIKHIGLWLHTKEGLEMLGNAGLTPDDLINHFCVVNNSSRYDFKESERKAFALWNERSQHEWKQDFGKWL
jgi:hypothetical protein